MDRFKSFQYNLLNEKLILFGGGAKYGQIVFLAGGGGSGKGFVTKNFMEGDKFKVRDVDEFKRLLIKINDLKGKYPELANMDLRNPNDVLALHKFVDKLDIKNKTLDNLLVGIKEGRLPNIIFDITMKQTKSVTNVIPMLLELGYITKNIHLVWVLTDYRVAVSNNAERSRVVPDDILLQTHQGAALSIVNVIRGRIKGLSNQTLLDGDIKVVLNNKENTIFWTDSNGKKIKNSNGDAVIKDFKYLTVKTKGKPITKDENIRKQLFDWVKASIPRTSKTKHIWNM